MDTRRRSPSPVRFARGTHYGARNPPGRINPNALSQPAWEYIQGVHAPDEANRRYIQASLNKTYGGPNINNHPRIPRHRPGDPSDPRSTYQARNRASYVHREIEGQGMCEWVCDAVVGCFQRCFGRGGKTRRHRRSKAKKTHKKRN